MDQTVLSSGDLIADRRFHYADQMAENGDVEGAIDLLSQTMELVPKWAAGWLKLGRICLDAHRQGDAVQAFLKAAELDPRGELGAQMHLAQLGALELQAETQTAYTRTLFDAYARTFEEELVVGLQYDAPRLLWEMIAEHMADRGVVQFANALDLGCGTGLMGERIRQVTSFLSGVDLSPRMVDRCQQKGLYDTLSTAEMLAFMAVDTGDYALVTAADVLMYCANLADAVGVVPKVLAEGGIFAFSVELHDGEEAQRLGESLRYAHSRAGVITALEAAGLAVAAMRDGVLRWDRGEPVHGLLVLAERTGPEDYAATRLASLDADIGAASVEENSLHQAAEQSVH